eukprot:TRINITY_DN83944_c0_g1_i1.p1 TRINITY_DN83944_c0_g1~~TRINITY_DN83944_c0_g1_i1.p1  ORF type:complete len:386 (-),score=48.12 TRINITY_DN83944_c0_g1_i1:128-1285(-)
MAESASKRARIASGDQEKNEAVVLNKIDDMSLQPWPMPEVAADECLVAVKCVGICGSDVHYWKDGRIGHFVLNKPMVIGHESSGVVVRVGSDVQGLKPGDRVAMEPGVPCDKCNWCRTSKYNLCPVLTGANKEPLKGRQGFFATPPVHGSMAKYIAHPARYCFVLPDSVSLEEGAMCEPLSVGVYACEQRAKVAPGSSVAVFGAGPIGTFTSMVAHGLGAKRIILCDIAQERLDFVRDKCCPVVPLNTKGMNAEQIAAKIQSLNEDEAIDSAIDCSGAETCIQAAILSTKTGGSVCIVGMGKLDQTLPLMNASMREVDLCGVFRYRYTYPKCIELLAGKKVNVDPLITHRFKFTQESIMDAFETCRTGRDGAIKCMIHVDELDSK